MNGQLKALSRSGIFNIFSLKIEQSWYLFRLNYHNLFSPYGSYLS